MNKIKEYMTKTAQLAMKVADTQNEAIEEAAKAVADTLERGGTVYTFGTGHSHILAEEIFYRAGGLVKVYPILDEPLMLHTGASRSSEMERLSGYASILLDNNLGIQPGDVMFIFSNYGRNTVSVDMAICAKEKGMKTICITNMEHTNSVTSRHPSGKKMYEVCDIVIDNCGCIGDASIEIGGKMC
ncbi:MAG: SIS domain-containing protein, partial [Clostridiales bacterium]|nr:SIS domain-containing protein [Clostridiales bacterium]